MITLSNFPPGNTLAFCENCTVQAIWCNPPSPASAMRDPPLTEQISALIKI
ncbi:hypothetical protein J2S30_002903 [Herbaspirillum rubrisubalbicans]|nr:hypothetical protein [Herbaspirillum rubrisubalbicans]